MLPSLAIFFGICLYFYKKYDDDCHDGIRSLCKYSAYISGILFLFIVVLAVFGLLFGASRLADLS